MGLIRTTPITGPSAWKGADFEGDSSWIYHFTQTDIAELEAALACVKRSGLSFPEFGRDQFALPTLSAQLADIAVELEDGRGFCLLRGLPVERYAEEDINIIYYGIGLNLGQPVRQNPKGDLLGQVMNVGDLTDKNTRVYQTNRYLPYHTDPSDVVGLLCIRKARTGGLSSLVSVPSVYNDLLARFPEYLGLFYKQWFYAPSRRRPAKPHSPFCNA